MNREQVSSMGSQSWNLWQARASRGAAHLVVWQGLHRGSSRCSLSPRIPQMPPCNESLQAPWEYLRYEENWQRALSPIQLWSIFHPLSSATAGAVLYAEKFSLQLFFLRLFHISALFCTQHRGTKVPLNNYSLSSAKCRFFFRLF